MAGRLKNLWDSIGNSIFGEQKNTMPVFGNPPPPPRAYLNVWTVGYTGEKNLGEMGPVKNYVPEYETLRLRSWQAYLESDIAQTILNKYSKWVIGSGLKLQTEPAKVVLKSEKININSEEFNEVTEARFAVYSKSLLSDYSSKKNLHQIAKSAFKNAIIGGDVLVILRYINQQVKVQLVDGAHLASPMFGSDHFKSAKESGNEIRHGIEMSPTGEHVAYYVKKDLLNFERIPAKGKESGLKMAFLIYGLEFRLDSVRGLPLISAVLESIKTLERYKSATVGSAEERQKIAYSIEHQVFSTGENPLIKNIGRAFNADAVGSDVSIDAQGEEVANTIAASTNKQAFNMPIGSQLKALDSRNELSFGDFYTINSNHVCAAIGIPPEVAYSKYDSNFSASRAALGDWQHTINVDRNDFSLQFYQYVYEFWLEVSILENKIQAPGYLTAKSKENEMVMAAYRNARWIGANIPHIDPLKEVNAVRKKLGIAADSIPLMTIEQATEELGGGDSDQNLLQFSEELKEAEKLNVVKPVPPPPQRG